MRIGSYQVLLELGRGGMGTVYLGRALGVAGFERLVAIKRAHPHLLSWQGIAERFLDEARMAALVHHANVVSMHGVGEDADGPYLVFDYVEGASLADLTEKAWAKQTSMPSEVVVRVVLDGLLGLHAAHEALDGRGQPLNMLHRDVSLQNLLVGADGVTRLSDFGIAKSALSSVVTDERYLQGKVLYLPPEYLERKPVDRTLDVYGMGVTLWLALSSQQPWPELSGAQLMVAIVTEGMPSLATVRPDLPEQLIAVVDRACAMDPRSRYQTARDMHDALEQVAHAMGLRAGPQLVSEHVQATMGRELAARKEALHARRRELEGEAEASAQDEAATPLKPHSHKVELASSARRRWWPVAALVVLASGLTWLSLHQSSGSAPAKQKVSSDAVPQRKEAAAPAASPPPAPAATPLPPASLPVHVERLSSDEDGGAAPAADAPDASRRTPVRKRERSSSRNGGERGGSEIAVDNPYR